jgi:hypothetical protein
MYRNPKQTAPKVLSAMDDPEEKARATQIKRSASTLAIMRGIGV